MTMRPNRLITLLVVNILISESIQQIAFTELTKIGVIRARNYKLKIKGSVSTQPMVIKLIPNLNNLSSCTNHDDFIKDYKELLIRILKPINDSLGFARSVVQSRSSGFRFWGAVIGGVALGVAASAQVTAAIALHKANQNAAMIKNLKSAIINTNKAVEKLQTTTSRILLTISALQEQINTNIVPVVNQLGCNVAINSIKLQLNRYFSELSLIFGPNLRDPSSQTLSIQAISQAFNGDFESMLAALDYKKDDFLDLIQSDSIRGRIIDVDMENFFISLQIEYPDLITIDSAIIQEFNLISHNDKGVEWMSAFPRAILKRGNFLSNIDLKDCSQTDISYVCQEDTSTPMSATLYNCVQGRLEDCARSLVVNSHVSRFALLDGVVFANCVPITCVCTQSDQHLIQDVSASNVMISSENCQEVQIDGMYITVGPRRLNRTMYAHNIVHGPPISTNPIDVSNQLANAEQSIKESKKYLDESNKILSRINPSLVNTGIVVFIIIFMILIIIVIGVIIYWLCRINNKVNQYEFMNKKSTNFSTVSSMSSLIPGI
ncbi:fusion protein [Bat paramyxovirus]|uniref:Fusion glycoprotein F0 n=1 Tax=bat paramyxovirus 16797 TaxID=3070194 RepID=A0AA48FD86_9MONO|nr:fusion protein [Bat paramyxovirus]AYM47530.1 fusion protein [bat paramyxovirus 16797]